jgi:hypothetical protein
MTTTVTSTQAETRLKDLETQIERGAESVQEAITEIHDDMLWRSGLYDTFGNYCFTRWEMSKAQAYRMLVHARVLGNIAETLVPESPIGDFQPKESHSRQLKRLPDEQQGKVWREVVESTGGKPTAIDVQRAVNSETGEQQPGVEVQIEKLETVNRSFDRHASIVSKIAHEHAFERPREFMNALQQAKILLASMIGQLRGAGETEEQK